MAATWSVSQMEDFIVGPEGSVFEGESRVVFVVHWQCIDETTVDETTYSARVYGSQGLQPFTGSQFTPWADVTEAQALEWLHDKMGAAEVTRCESNVAAKLQSQINPTTETGIPW